MPAGSKVRRSVAILGATGSIGRQALDVIKHLQASDPDCEWSVRSLSCDSSVEELAALARRCKAAVVNCSAAQSAAAEAALSGSGTRVLAGPDGLVTLATDPEADIVLFAIFGTAAIAPLLAAIEAGKTIALASKEALVAAGPFIMEAARRRKADIRPVDSEHSALWQCLAAAPREALEAAVITASGGPFRSLSAAELETVTYEQALQHPVWSMGAGITINSATLFNKGLEVIEAHHLFSLAPEQIEVQVHPQGQVHAMARLRDGSLILHAAAPDMRLPIQLALTHPRRLPPAAEIPAARLGGWDFEPVDDTRFPALSACRRALAGPWWLPAALLALNEELCRAFQQGALRFPEIGATLLELASQPSLLKPEAASLDAAFPHELYAVYLVEQAARQWASRRIATLVQQRLSQA